jgi:hypothetical protein
VRQVLFVASTHVRRADEARAALSSAGFSLAASDRAPQITLETWRR